jgi:hypothetical protein
MHVELKRLNSGSCSFATYVQESGMVISLESFLLKDPNGDGAGSGGVVR